MTENQYPDEWSFEDFVDTRVIVVQVACLLLTLAAVALPAVKLRTVKSPFFIFCLLTPVPCLLADVSYFMTITKVITVNQNEVPRVMSGFMSLWLVCTLSSVRFRAFHKAGTVLWYTDRRSRVIISTLFLQGVVTTAVLAYTYVSQAHLPYFPTHPWRKASIALQAGTSIFVNFIIDTFSFLTVWQIRMGVLRRNSDLLTYSMSKATATETITNATATATTGAQTVVHEVAEHTPGHMRWWWVPASALARIRHDLTQSRSSGAGSSAAGGGGTSSCGPEGSSDNSLPMSKSRPLLSLSNHPNTRSSMVSSPIHGPSFATGLPDKAVSQSALQLPSPGVALTSSPLLSPSSDSPTLLSQSTALLQPGSISTAHSLDVRKKRRKSREEKRFARFKQTTAVVMCMLAFLLLSSIIGLIVYLNLAHLFGDTMSALAARIYIVACFVNWTILAQVVR